MPSWFDPGPYVPEPMTDRQRSLLVLALRNQPDRVLDLLGHEERVAAELMGADEWLGTLTKWDATRLIGALKDRDVAAKVRRRDDPDAARPWWAPGR